MLSDTQRASLAARLRQGRVAAAPTTPAGVVRLNDGPVEKNLLLFHAIGGTVFAYGHLARELTPDLRVWGVPSPVDEPEAETSLQALVERHLAVVRRVQPSGPYRLAGWSMGGILAYEIARELRAAGEDVTAVGLLDSPFWLPAELAESEAEFVGLFVSDAARSFDASAGQPPNPVLASVNEQLSWLAARLGSGEGIRAELDRRYLTFRTNTELLAGYRPSGPLNGDTLIIEVEESSNMSRMWLDVTQGTANLVSLPGNHYSFLQPPTVTVVAAALRDALA